VGNGEPTPHELRSALRRLVIATVVLYAALAGVVTVGFLNARSQRADLTAALCRIRTDQEQRIAASERFIEENPRGIDGLTPALIRQGIREAQEAVDALATLDCGS